MVMELDVILHKILMCVHVLPSHTPLDVSVPHAFREHTGMLQKDCQTPTCARHATVTQLELLMEILSVIW